MRNLIPYNKHYHNHHHNEHCNSIHDKKYDIHDTDLNEIVGTTWWGQEDGFWYVQFFGEIEYNFAVKEAAQNFINNFQL